MVSLLVQLNISHSTVQIDDSPTFASSATKQGAMQSFCSQLRADDRRAPMAIFVNTHTDGDGMVTFSLPAPFVRHYGLGSDVDAASVPIGVVSTEI